MIVWVQQCQFWLAQTIIHFDFNKVCLAVSCDTTESCYDTIPHLDIAQADKWLFFGVPQLAKEEWFRIERKSKKFVRQSQKEQILLLWERYDFYEINAVRCLWFSQTKLMHVYHLEWLSKLNNFYETIVDVVDEVSIEASKATGQISNFLQFPNDCRVNSKLIKHMNIENGSEILFLLVDRDVIWTALGFNGWRPDAPITPPGPNNKLFFAELSPIWHSFLSAPLPLVLCQNPVLLYHLSCFKLLHFSGIVGLLQPYNLIFLIVDLLKYFMTHFLILRFECVGREWLLTVFNSLFILFFSFELCAFSGFLHNSQVNFPFFRVN